MSSRWIRLLGAAFACLLLLGCGEDGPEPEDNEIANLEETAPLANLVDESQSTTDGLQIVTIENRSDKTIWAYAYHNGCDVNAISGLCHDEGLSPGTSMTYTPDGIIRSYDDVVKVFTYVAEAIQMAVSVVLTVATAGAGSGFIAEEVAQVAGEAADAAVEAVEAGAEGAEAAGAGAEASIEDGLNLSIEGTGGGPRFTWAEKLIVNTSTAVPLGTVSGGLKGGYQHGFTGALNGALQSFERSVVGSVSSLDGIAGLNGALGAYGSSALAQGIKDLQAIAEEASSIGGKIAGRLSSFGSYLSKKFKSEEDELTTLVKSLGQGVEKDTPIYDAALRAFNKVKDSNVTKGLIKFTQKEGKRVLQHIKDDNTPEDLNVTWAHIQTIADDLNADPANRELLAELTEDFINQNVSADRGIRALAVAHNLYDNADSIQDTIVSLFNSEDEIENIYKDYLPPQLLTHAEQLNTYYHLALSSQDHTLYARLNTTWSKTPPLPEVLLQLEGQDIAEVGFAVDETILRESGYLPLHELTATDAQNVQNLMQFARMAVGMPIPIKLWSNAEWTYTVEYNSKLYRNIAGFFRESAEGAPSFDHWYAPWHAPGDPKHNTFWQEVVGYTNNVGAFYSGNTSWDLTGLHPSSQHLYIDDDNQLEMYVADITDDEWEGQLAAIDSIFGSSDPGDIVMVTLSTDESINWWKGVTVTAPGVVPTTGQPDSDTVTYPIAVEADGAPQSIAIPLGEFPWLVAEGLFPADLLLTDIEFQAAKTFGVHYPVGQTTYKLLDLAGKHVRFHWTHDGGGDSDFYDVPKTYDVDGDGINIVESTQAPRSGGGAEILFKIGDGINWWKGIALQKSDGNKIWLGTKNNISKAPGSIFSADPEAEWGKYVHVELWKAAFLGVHSYQKRIKIPTSQLINQVTTFDWKFDDTNYGPLRSSYTADGGHDSISVQTTDLSADLASESVIHFKVAPGITWWKSIQIRLVDGEKTLQWTQDGTTTATTVALSKALLPEGSEVAVEFWKAKSFGIHTYVGEAKITWDSIAGKEVTFTWEND